MNSFVSFFLSFFFWTSVLACSFKDEKTDIQFEKVRPGMNKEQVIQILGPPDTIGRSVVDSEFVFVYYYIKNALAQKGSRSVSFSNSGKVLFTTKDED